MKKKRKKNSQWKRELPLHLMILPSAIMVFIFSYIPLYGLTIAFKKFNPAKGLFGENPWCGLDNYAYIFSLPNIGRVFSNTLLIAVAKIIFGMIIAIAVALLLNECRCRFLKRNVQTLIYFPYFISWIILGGIMTDILSPSDGIINQLISFWGADPVYFLGDNRIFPGTLVVSDIWRNFGYNSIVYLAAITSIDPSLYEAAAIDGAGRWKQTLHITLPGMSTIIILMCILSLGNVLNAGFDQVYNLYSVQVYESGDIIDTLVYRIGLQQAQFGPSTAVGLLKSVISFILISFAYLFAWKKYDYRVF
ncbi:MAG: ABC transporter permease subunit [Eubacteriales bacterium]|nr:ABC transporter permease subunit [Eubacteriales bacterium]